MSLSCGDAPLETSACLDACPSKWTFRLCQGGLGVSHTGIATVGPWGTRMSMTSGDGSQRDSRRGRILVVDDQADVRDVLARILEKGGHAVAEADGVAGARSSARTSTSCCAT